MYFNPQQFGPLVHQRIKELRRQAEVERELRKRSEPVQTTPVRAACPPVSNRPALP